MGPLYLWPEDPTVTLTPFCGTCDGVRPALLILPGGGYNTCAPFECDPVAQRFAELGYAAFVLRYAVRYPSFEDMRARTNFNPKTLFPIPLRQVAAAVRHIRENAGMYGADPAQVILMGFSAGGHLASTYMSLWNTPDVAMGADPEVLRPNACILGYAASELTPDEVLMGAIYGEKGSYSQEEIDRYTARNHVKKGVTPPTFLFHSVTDPMVPVEESLRLAQALTEADIPCELHLFGAGGHAYALGEGTAQGAWVDLADTFLHGVFASPEAYDRDAEKARMALRFGNGPADFARKGE